MPDLLVIITILKIFALSLINSNYQLYCATKFILIVMLRSSATVGSFTKKFEKNIKVSFNIFKTIENNTLSFSPRRTNRYGFKNDILTSIRNDGYFYTSIIAILPCLFKLSSLILHILQVFRLLHNADF
jgi:hypothetical protein